MSVKEARGHSPYDKKAACVQIAVSVCRLHVNSEQILEVARGWSLLGNSEVVSCGLELNEPSTTTNNRE